MTTTNTTSVTVNIRIDKNVNLFRNNTERKDFQIVFLEITNLGMR